MGRAVLPHDKLEVLVGKDSAMPSVLEQLAEWHHLLSLFPSSWAFSEREIVQRVLHLANDPTDEQKAGALFVTLLSHGMQASTVAGYVKQVGKEFVRKAWNGIADERALFRSRVQSIFEDRDKARRTLEAVVSDDIKGVVLVPSVTLKDWEIQYDLRYFAISLRASCAFALALLLDESKQYGEALSTCRLSLCPNFFLSLSSGKGGRPRLFCSTDHQKESVAAGEADRKRKQRAAPRKPK